MFCLRLYNPRLPRVPPLLTDDHGLLPTVSQNRAEHKNDDLCFVAETAAATGGRGRESKSNKLSATKLNLAQVLASPSSQLFPFLFFSSSLFFAIVGNDNVWLLGFPVIALPVSARLISSPFGLSRLISARLGWSKFRRED